MAADQLYFRQWRSGREFARDLAGAEQMANFAYAVGDRRRGEALLVDPAWGPADLLDALAADGMTPVGVLISHFHADHAGGDLFGHAVPGLAELLGSVDVPVHANRHEVTWITRSTGLAEAALVGHDAGDTVTVGELEVTLLHTPGHTPGSQCFLVDGRLVSGDTLFLPGCGRTDLPGSDPAAMYDSLRLLASLPPTTTVFPGHDYSPPTTSAGLDAVTATNPVFLAPSRDVWLRMFAGA